MRRSTAAMGALALSFGFLLAAVPPAAAHCDGITGSIGPVSKCFLHTLAEDTVEALNAAGNGEYAFVLAKDFRFHPENVTIRSGGTVYIVWADFLGPQVHDPRNSVSTGDQALDRMKPAPPIHDPVLKGHIGRCFDILRDTQPPQNLDQGDVYYLTFRYDEPTGSVAKSHGILTDQVPVVGDPPVSEDYQPCADEVRSVSPDPGKAVLPYHCGLHGVPGGVNGQSQMRGSITIIG